MKLKPSWKWFEIGLVLFGLALHLWAALGPLEAVLGWYDSDDAFYYYKIAQNITTGQGMTFDGINRTNGFHPLWMAVCVPVFWLARFDLVLPLRVLMLVSAAFSLGAGILIFRLLKKFVPPEAAALAAMVWSFLPSIHRVVVQGGLETSASAFFLMLTFYLAAQWRIERDWKRLALLGLSAGLAILARLDNVFVILLLGVWFSLVPATAYLRTVAAGDLALIFISGLLAYYLRLDNRFEYIQNSVSLPYLVGLAFLLKPLALFLFGLYRLAEQKITWKFVACLLGASTLASALLAGLLIGLQALHVYSALPRAVILIDWLLTTAGLLLLRLLAWKAWPEKTEFASLRAWDGWKVVFERAVGYYLPALGLLGVYMAFNHFYIGSAMPVSGQIKRWWGGLNTIYGRPVRSEADLFGLDAWQLVNGPVESIRKTLESSPRPEGVSLVVSLLVLLCLAGLLWLVFSHRARIVELVDDLGLFVIFVGLYAQIFSYTSTLYMHRRAWYWSGELLFTVIWIGLLVGLLFGRLKSRAGRVTGRLILAALSLVWVASLAAMFQNLHTSADIQRESRRIFSEVEFLEANTPAGSLIGVTGGGTVAYFLQDRTIVNLDGLVNSPEYFALMQENRAAELLDKIDLDYVYGRDYKLLNSAPYQNMLAGRLELLLELSEVRYLYRYISSGK
jgi:hypothetical protein